MYLLEICTLQVAEKTWVLVVYGISFICDIANSSNNMVLSVRMISESNVFGYCIIHINWN